MNSPDQFSGNESKNLPDGVVPIDVASVRVGDKRYKVLGQFECKRYYPSGFSCGEKYLATYPYVPYLYVTDEEGNYFVAKMLTMNPHHIENSSRLTQQHPVEGITPVIAHEGIKEGEFYLTPYVEGLLLDKYILNYEEGDLPEFTIGTLRSLFIDLFKKLKNSHECDVLLRDIKESNMFVRRGFYGIEGIFFDNDLASNTITVNRRNVVGTPLYLSPQAVRGYYYPECDVFSMGVTLAIACGETDVFKGYFLPHSLDDRMYERASGQYYTSTAHSIFENGIQKTFPKGGTLVEKELYEEDIDSLVKAVRLLLHPERETRASIDQAVEILVAPDHYEGRYRKDVPEVIEGEFMMSEDGHVV